jgi:hypothetical protein
MSLCRRAGAPTSRRLSRPKSRGGATRRLPGAGFALAAAAFAVLWLRPAVSAEERPLDPSLAPAITLSDGKLSVELRDADLEDVLQEIARRAGFHLTTSGQLRRVTAALTGVSLEDGLRRLVQDHELMLVYRPAERGGAAGALVEVHVFAALPAPDPAQTAASLAEVNRLLRRRGDRQSVARLTDLLSASPDPAVRARAAWALGRTRAPAGAATLTKALSDPAAPVRMHAALALRGLQGVQAIPALASLLLQDPDAIVRRAAATALGSLRDASAIPPLRAALGDADLSVRQQATQALRRQGVVAP